jgi:hypothetical protein
MMLMFNDLYEFPNSLDSNHTSCTLSHTLPLHPVQIIPGNFLEYISLMLSDVIISL